MRTFLQITLNSKIPDGGLLKHLDTESLPLTYFYARLFCLKNSYPGII